MGVASNRIARKSLIDVYGNFEIEGREYTDFWTLGMWSFSSYYLGVRRFLNSASMKTSLELFFNPLNAKLNPICHLLALLVAHHILHVSSIRVTYL